MDENEIEFQLINKFNPMSELHALNFTRNAFMIGNGYMNNVHLIKHNEKIYITGNLPTF